MFLLVHFKASIAESNHNFFNISQNHVFLQIYITLLYNEEIQWHYNHDLLNLSGELCLCVGAGQSVILQGYLSCLLNQGLSLAWNSRAGWLASKLQGPAFLSPLSQCWAYGAHTNTQQVFVCFLFFLALAPGTEPRSSFLSDRRFPGRLNCPPSEPFFFEPSVANLRVSLYVFWEIRSDLSL